MRRVYDVQRASGERLERLAVDGAAGLAVLYARRTVLECIEGWPQSEPFEFETFGGLSAVESLLKITFFEVMCNGEVAEVSVWSAHVLFGVPSR